MRRTTNPCEWKRLSGLYLAAPCGNDNDHLGSKRTTIHLNPGPPGKTHNPPHTDDPPRDRQRGRNGTLRKGIRQSKTHSSPFPLDSAWLFNIPWNTLHLLAAINSFLYQIFTFTPMRLCYSLCPLPFYTLPLFTGPSIWLIPFPKWWFILFSLSFIPLIWSLTSINCCFLF